MLEAVNLKMKESILLELNGFWVEPTMRERVVTILLNLQKRIVLQMKILVEHIVLDRKKFSQR
ncbi:MAG: hypothetical protein HYV28_19095 [Ignavibacteriales bacterium]|nr:hypothetical protein [Ignavibacteriales bacterium]